MSTPIHGNPQLSTDFAVSFAVKSNRRIFTRRPDNRYIEAEPKTEKSRLRQAEAKL